MMISLLLLLINFRISQIDFYEPEFQQVRVTCYYTGSRFANGEKVYEGGCAGQRKDIGKYVVIRTDQDEHILKITDCGGYLIESGQRIDVYRNNLQRCYDWVHQYGDYQQVSILTEEELIRYEQNNEKWVELQELQIMKGDLEMQKEKELEIAKAFIGVLDKIKEIDNTKIEVGEKTISFSLAHYSLLIDDVPTLADAMNISWKMSEQGEGYQFKYCYEMEFCGLVFRSFSDEDITKKGEE